MALNGKSESGTNKDKNLILVSNSSDLFPDAPLNMLLSRNSSHPIGDYRRNSSYSNLFPAFTQESRMKQEQPRKEDTLTDAQKYAQQCLEYEKYAFDQKIRLLIHRMAILSYHNFKERIEHPFLTFFIERFLCTLAKKLLLNRFELLFLEYIFEESRWKYENQLISICGQEFKPFVHIPQSENPNGLVRNLQVYMLFCAYYSKKSLNEIASEGVFTHFFKDISQNFKERYNQWSQSTGIVKMKINPKVLNLIFRRLSSFQERDRDYYENYNLMVEEILQISPAYNADKENKVRRKKRKVEEDPKQEDIRDPESNANEGNQPIRSLPPEESPPEFLPSFRKKPTSYVENLNGLDPVAYYNRNNDQ